MRRRAEIAWRRSLRLLCSSSTGAGGSLKSPGLAVVVLSGVTGGGAPFNGHGGRPAVSTCSN
eukprot:scaffold5082_cov75-Attheya_sp.AAC.1